MQITPISRVLANGHLSIRDVSLAGTGQRPATQPNRYQGASIWELRQLMHQSRQLREALDGARSTIRGILQRGTRAGAGLARVASSRPIGLNRTETATQLASHEEVNNIATSFSPFGPTFHGQSTSLPTIGGVYNGTTDETLTFQTTRNRTVGGNRQITVEVYDEAGQRVDRLRFEPFTAPDTPLTLDNGLTLSLSAGDVKRDDTFQVHVSAQVGSAVDPDKPFNGLRNDQANLEPGRVVKSGSFDVNGIRIQVQESDSINTVLDKINSAGSYVIAAFDAVSERVILSHESLGSQGIIKLENDTSGFLAATKLDTAVADPGIDRDASLPLAQVSRFSGIRSGDLVVNGVRISVDRDQDSLEGLLQRINSAAPQVVAEYDESRDVVRLRANGGRGPVTVGDGSSGFFSVVGIRPGTYSAGVKRMQLGKSDREFVAHQLNEITEKIRGMTNATTSLAGRSHADRIIHRLQDTIAAKLAREPGAIEANGEYTISGLRFNTSGGGDKILEVDLDALAKGLAERDASLTRVFRENSSVSGKRPFIGALQDVLRDEERALRLALAEQGASYLDLRV